MTADLQTVEVADQVATIIVHYNTPDLLSDAVRSFKRAYPDVTTYIVDNGSEPESLRLIESLSGQFNRICPRFLERNEGHGPGMHSVMKEGAHQYYFCLDSDTVTKEGGFLEKMAGVLEEHPDVYGVGKVAPFNRRGFYDEGGFPMLIAAYMLLRGSQYSQLPPFHHHGAPVGQNFIAANRLGLKLHDFPIDRYIEHLHRGTAKRFGYGLGLRGKINYLLNKLGLS